MSRGMDSSTVPVLAVGARGFQATQRYEPLELVCSEPPGTPNGETMKP